MAMARTSAVVLRAAERQKLLDRFRHELDASERIAPMEHGYARIEPYIVDQEQPGATFALIVYHRESEAWFGKKEEDRSFRHLLERRAIRIGDVVFDLGCNSGFTTCWYAMMVGPTGKVVGFDPFPWNAIATRYSAELNGLRHVEVHQLGIGAAEERPRISLHDARTSVRGGSSLVDVGIVPITRFAALRPSVLKIDIEGAEYEVSRSDLARLDRLRLCVLELHPDYIAQRGLSAQDCLDNFRRNGFAIHPEKASGVTDDLVRGGEPAAGFYYLERAVPSRFVVTARRTLSPLLRSMPSRRLRVTLAEREHAILEREATVRQREATIRQHEATIRALERELAVQAEAPAPGSATIGAPQAPTAGVGNAGDGREVAMIDRRSPLEQRIKNAVPRMEGWCTERKALWLADLITRHRCESVLEIGIFGGRSLIPMALAVQALGAGGRVFGIEAWSNSVAIATETNAENDAWWSTVDMKAIKTGFLSSVVANDVAETVVVLEMSSDKAFAAIAAMGLGPFDLVHVDGSHSAEQALRDVRQWSSLVRPGGILVLDDILWPSVKAAREHVRASFSDIEEIVEGGTIGYGAYRRGRAHDVAAQES
ncbi:MAG: FkbM family methyltransferase [Bauldia sp.]|nr:FkbM family methyltransferase [Bauldia sp.]